MQVAICDDDKGCCNQIKKWLERYSRSEKEDINVEVYYSGEDLLTGLENKCWFDLIFLDIELPEISGVELGTEIRKSMKNYSSNIVFISGKTEYCLALFQIEPLNFHQKPLLEQDIIRDVQRVMIRQENGRKVLKYIDEGITKGILYRDIKYLEAKGKKITIYLTSGKSIIIRDSLNRLEEELDRFYFCRCHRAFIVNMSCIRKYFNRVFYLDDDIEIAVGEKYATNVKRKFAAYDFRED